MTSTCDWLCHRLPSNREEKMEPLLIHCTHSGRSNTPARFKCRSHEWLFRRDEPADSGFYMFPLFALSVTNVHIANTVMFTITLPPPPSNVAAECTSCHHLRLILTLPTSHDSCSAWLKHNFLDLLLPAEKSHTPDNIPYSWGFFT